MTVSDRDHATEQRREPPLAGRTALVTGAAQGIGAATARRLAADGAHVVVNDRVDSPALRDLAESIGGVAIAADVSDRDAVRDMVERVHDRVAPIELVVCNAAYMSMAPLPEHALDDWWRVVDTNLGGTFHVLQAVVPSMQERGFGRVVVITSEWGVIGWPNATAYSASKAGLVSLVKTLGRELAPPGITVNAIAPSVVDTPQLEVDARDAGVSLDEIRQRYAASIPLGRIAAPEEIAATASFLLDPRLGALVGQIVSPNGGTTRSRV
ncbi:MAG: SDR family NAD(P)-dependent oxidoreductase [Actinomycetales bacterium]